MKYVLQFSVFLTLNILGCPLIYSQTQVVTVGNTADADPVFFEALQGFLASADEQTTLIINGDLTDHKCHDQHKEHDFSHLQLLLDVVKANPHIKSYLLPGDRDWASSGKVGWECVKVLEEYIEDQDIDNLRWTLDQGCPGPDVEKLSSSTLLITLNTQWWNHPHRKPTPSDAVCDYSEPSIVMEEIHDAVEENLDKNIIIAGHFPLQSQGRYGGEFPISDHFSTPILGSFKIAYRQNIGGPKDLHNQYYEPFLDEMKDIASQNQGIFFLGGHEPNQQLIGYSGNYIVNSGAPSKGRWVAKHKPAIFTSTLPGFTVLTFEANGQASYQFYEVLEDGIILSKNLMLFDQACNPVTGSNVPANPNYQPCFKEVDSLALIKPELAATVLTEGGNSYGASKTKRFFLGDHYRATWLAPVVVPVLDLDTIKSGLWPTKRGGGRQTKSLKLETAIGERFVFRSVDKDPAGALNLELRNTIIADITRDQTSTQHPYGALPVASLLNEVDILHASPKLYVLGNIPRLGRFRGDYGNMLGMLEERPQNAKSNRTGTFGADKIYKSFELFDKRYDDQDLKINHHEFVRARLFDILIGDWSKHEDNWKWAVFKQDKDQLLVRPIPRDRDHAFSQLDGFIPWLASRRWAVPNLEHFDYEIQDVRSLTYQARHMDRLLLSPLSREDFLKEVSFLQQHIGPQEIQAAIQTLPEETLALSGNTIASKLDQRIQDLEEYANTYYELHAKVVDVVGTNKEEHFLITRLPNANTRVTVTDPKGDQRGRVLYDRLFWPSETKEIRIYGLGDDDTFEITGTSSRAITVRIIGGPGKDDIIDSGDNGSNTSILVYENDPDAKIILNKGSKQVKNWRDELYFYQRDAYEYNSYLPLANLTFNSFSGVTLGTGITFTQRSFTRRDYSSKHSIRGAVSTLSNISLQYAADWHHVLHKWDVLAEANVERPSFYNFFFGLGNNSTKDDDAFRDGFNQIRLRRVDFSSTLRRKFRRQSEFTLQMGYENNETVETENTILDTTTPFYGTGDLSWFYLRPNLTIDLRDHQVFPSKGMRLMAGQEWTKGTEAEFGITSAAGEFFLSTRRFPITLAARIGWAESQGKVPFYKLPSIGQQEGLRGFRRNRFTGDGYFYYNTELRCPVALWRNAFLPVVVGIRAFYDNGYVTMDETPKPDFKQAYGGGLYIIPLSRSYTLSVLFGFSDEESGIIDLNLGTNF
ncbi:MAG: BamA/TamA family outer membrane protein [Lewinella sp.]|uniref:BamA/TamA family outer membrane protein n=1 Tax=Lewinella sp. TaxID=2004506 RepID=UPI003D6A2616